MNAEQYLKENYPVCTHGFSNELIQLVAEAMTNFANQPKWISVDEHLPEKDGQYNVIIQTSKIVNVKGKARTTLFYRKFYNLWYYDFENLTPYTNVTHWQPFPNF